MVLRKCQQCNSVFDDKYGFCIKCGFEFPKIDEDSITCIKCGNPNPKDAEFCVKCGIPLKFSKQMENKPIIIKYGNVINNDNNQENTKNNYTDTNYKPVNRWIIIFGYIFSILGGIIGLIIALYLVTRKDPDARKHGKIQLGIFIFYLIIIGICLGTGVVTPQELMNITSMSSLNEMKF